MIQPSFTSNAENFTRYGIAHLLALIFAETNQAAAEHIASAGMCFEWAERNARFAESVR